MINITEGDLLYHAVHGLCRVVEIDKQKEAGKETLSYSLVPKAAGRMKTRFIIGAAGMEESGFHTLASLKEANKILGYLKKPASTLVGQNQAWDFAKTIRLFSHEKFEAKDQRKRQQLERSVRGLVGEFSLIFKISLKETATRIQKSLGSAPRVNPAVLVAIEQAGED